MRNFLERGLSVGKEQIDAFTRQAGPAQGSCESVRDSIDTDTEVLVEITQQRDMSTGDHEQMTRIHRMKIHERDHMLILMDLAAR